MQILKIYKNHQQIKSKDININIKTINIEKLIEMMLIDNKYEYYNKLDIRDIKDYNDKEKVMLEMFINMYVNINPSITEYNKYADLLFKKINILEYKHIFRGFYVGIDILIKNNLLSHNNILQIGVLPTLLESYTYLNNKLNKCDFIKIESKKKSSSLNSIDLYNNLISKFRNYNLLDINDFYNTEINNIDDNIYDLIMCDVYKNISKYQIDNYDNVNIRYLSALVHSKYILHELLFCINKLKKGGDIILLFPGFLDDVYKQLIIIIRKLFDEVIIFNSEIDFSFRVYLIGKNYKPDSDIINKLKSIKIDDILINLIDLPDLPDLPDDNNISINLVDKFNKIDKQLNNINKYFDNQKLIKKVYHENYYIQLTNTYKWLKSFKVTNNIVINDEIIQKLDDYKLSLADKLIKMNLYVEHDLNKDIDFKKFNIICDDVKNIDEYVKSIKYLELLDIFGYNKDIGYIGYLEKDYNLLKNNLLGLSDKTDKIDYIDIDEYLKNSEKSYNLFEGLKDNIVIRFRLQSLSSFVLSLFYVLTNIYKTTKIKSDLINGIYYLVCDKLNNNADNNIKQLKMLYEKNLSKINSNFYLIALSDSFVVQINELISKLIMKELLLIIRMRYVYCNNEFIIYYKHKNKKIL
jgi:hypothetical protein